MELDFQKSKQRFAAMSDSELVSRSRDPDATATERMLIDAEIARRGLDRRYVPDVPDSMPVKKSGSSWFSWIFFVFVLGSIAAGILDDLGVDIVEWLRDLVSGE